MIELLFQKSVRIRVISSSHNMLTDRRRRNSFPILSKVSLSSWYDETPPDSSDDSENSSSGWIDNYLSSFKSKWLLRVPDEYILEDFNLYGLSEKIPQYVEALEIIRDLKQVPPEELYFEDPSKPTLDALIQNLYFLIHQRYVQSEEGLKQVFQNYMQGVYGVCPRTECRGQYVVPCGISDQLGISECCIYCPRCKDIFHSYNTEISNIDGASFGTSFGPFFFRTYPHLEPLESARMLEQRVYGFRVADSHKRGVHPF
ncbi:Casein kinase II regulatory subunit family protein [Trichomonas vaginalis G3]|uniref:Casein kinase II subunit beta n=1 Tax=Trichomonas vaginalis (strain ATCC PRA-98 / G3) TaxID=412133 RepID=A2F105_TRIV3|nr:protein kinase regulator protein [Trichomonas vaginalis G3]EAY01413.1 Casein kinase II regulatory subunit family protein [Trichomonas vaginalis G3]KAI5529517.1 protein kinase regulator protein [Trichomonas vaginalis G3]|eukprot:XP_001330248.1 Casein kinase II regulatory subunit family protein [Trichomonas vaginalis G3]